MKQTIRALLLAALLTAAVTAGAAAGPGPAEKPPAGTEITLPRGEEQQTVSSKKERKKEAKRMWKRDREHILRRQRDRLLQNPIVEGDIILDPNTGEEYSASRLILVPAPDASEETLAALLEKYRMELLYDYKNFSMVAVKLERPHTPEELNALIAALEGEEAILSAEKDHVVHPAGTGGVTADK